MSGEDAFKRLPPGEQKVRRDLGKAMMHFVTQIIELVEPGVEQMEAELRMGLNPGDKIEMDAKLRRKLTEDFRLAVERAAQQGVELSLPWYNLATWTELGKARIGYFARALECVESGRDALPGTEAAQTPGYDPEMRADCLYEIARVHAHEGDAAVARHFLKRALPLAQEAEALREAAGKKDDGHLEAKIAELLVQLPDDGEAK